VTAITTETVGEEQSVESRSQTSQGLRKYRRRFPSITALRYNNMFAVSVASHRDAAWNLIDVRGDIGRIRDGDGTAVRCEFHLLGTSVPAIYLN